MYVTRRFALFTGGVFSGAVWACFAQSPPAIYWRVPERRITLHEPVIFELHVDNTSADPVRLDLGANFTAAFVVTVIAPDRTIIRKRLAPAGLQQAGVVVLAPG